MTSIVLKTDVTLMDIVSTRMLGQFGFLAQVTASEGLGVLHMVTLLGAGGRSACMLSLQVFDVFRDNQISVDVVATSEISVSLTLDQR